MPRLKSREYEALKAQWLQQRLTGIGASDASAILGINPWKSALRLYTEKVGIVGTDVVENELMEWGHRLEQPIADAYEDETGRPTFDPGDFAIQRHPTLEFAIVTLDRVVLVADLQRPDVKPPETLKPPPAPGDGVLEIKTTSAFNVEEWDEEPPLYYQVQLQHQLAVTGLQWGSLAVLIGGQMFRWQDLQRNDGFIAKLMDAEAEFWWRVQNKQPPPADASESSAQALALLYPKETQDTVALPVDLIEADEARMAAAKTIAEAEAIQLACENKLKAAMGLYTYGFLPNGVRYSWKTQTRPAHTVKESTFRVLRRKAPKGV